MASDDGMVKLYFEEIEPIDDDDDDDGTGTGNNNSTLGKNGFVVTEQFDSPREETEQQQQQQQQQNEKKKKKKRDKKKNSKITIGKKDSQQHVLDSGGILESLNLGTNVEQQKQHSELLETIKFPLKATTWKNLSNQGPEKRGGCTITNMENELYLFGGASRDGKHYNDLWIRPLNDNHDKNKNRWENITDLVQGNPPCPKSGHTATPFHQQQEYFLFVFGGLNITKQECFNDTFVLSQKSWMQISTCGTPPQPRTERSL